jgi:DNA-directed RNA polymerase subunit RPC12/RpoP
MEKTLKNNIETLLGGQMGMKCPNCGEEIRSDDAIACPKCATPLSGG